MVEAVLAPLVVVVGSVHTDFVATATRLPVAGETLPGSSFDFHPGGKGGNQAIAVAQAGGRAAIVGRVGADAFGRSLRDALETKGVDTAWLAEDPGAPTGASAVLSAEGGDYASVIVPGASMKLSPAHVAAAGPLFRHARIVLAQLEIAPETTLAALQVGRRGNATTILNASPVPDSVDHLPDSLWQAVDVLVVNRVETAMLGGMVIGTDPLTAATALRERLEVPLVVLTLGPDGAVAAAEADVWAKPGHPVQAIDAIGAGDAFVGALAVAIGSGMDTRSALRRANAAGALSVTRVGGFDAAPTAAEIDGFLRSRAE